jgi:NDP-sugar pyrophosphorylase family protein
VTSDPTHRSVAILAGGLGTRLRPALADRPKVLAPVAGRPFLCYLLDQLSRFAVREVVLLTGHRAGEVRAALGDRYRAMRLLYSTEETPLGTAGAVRLALPLLPAPEVLLLNGDSFGEIDLDAFARQHAALAAQASLALCQVPDTARFGRVHLDGASRIVGYDEKKGGGSGWINAGTYLLRRELIEATPSGRAVSLERDLLPGWLAGGCVYGYRSPGRFIDIGTPESYGEAEAFFAHHQPAGCN